MAIYIVLGFFDALSVLSLMFALYRFPFLEYKTKLISMAVIIAICSYIVRLILEIPRFDPLIQIILFIIFFRFFIQIKSRFAALIPTAGFAAYIFLQVIIFSTLQSIGLIHETDAAKTHGIGIYITQISSILAIYIISAAMQFFRVGFTFIPRPPHDFKTKDKHSFIAIWPTIVLSLIGISFSINEVLHLNVLIVVPIGFVMFSALYYFSYRRDKLERDRIYRSANFNKNK